MSWVLASTLAFAAGAENTQISAAREQLKKVQSLLEVGAASRSQVAEAQDRLDDAEDSALLHETVQISDLTDTQADTMVAAAERRVERRTRALDREQKLVDERLATAASLATLREDLDFAREERDLARERANITRELASMVQAEAALQQTLSVTPEAAPDLGDRYDGDGIFTAATFARVETAFQNHFGKALPISAMGETAVHRALGFDHTGRVDVALRPDQPEGRWLLQFLTQNHIPYFAFSQAVPGKATGAHIHLGPQSTRLAHGG